MICTNPDLIVDKGNERELCAGSVAMVFEKMGGKVVYFGKPYPEVYNQSIDNKNKKILSIGDNLNTDIKGANLLNYDSLLISNGVHKNEIKNNYKNFINKTKTIKTMVRDVGKKKYILNLQIISMLNYWKHYPRLKKEAELVYSLYEGGDFIDVGAHHGVYSFLLAPKANIDDTFVQCEPDPNAKKNLLGNLKVFKKLFSHIKLEFVFDPISNSDSVTKHPTDYGHPVYFSKIKNNVSEKSIDSVQIDELVEKLGLNPKFIKIDVEGHELQVLKGATETLKKHKPTILIEIHDFSEDSEIHQYLKSLGYGDPEKRPEAIFIYKTFA